MLNKFYRKAQEKGTAFDTIAPLFRVDETIRMIGEKYLSDLLNRIMGVEKKCSQTPANATAELPLQDTFENGPMILGKTLKWHRLQSRDSPYSERRSRVSNGKQVLEQDIHFDVRNAGGDARRMTEANFTGKLRQTAQRCAAWLSVKRFPRYSAFWINGHTRSQTVESPFILGDSHERWLHRGERSSFAKLLHTLDAHPTDRRALRQSWYLWQLSESNSSKTHQEADRKPVSSRWTKQLGRIRLKRSVLPRNRNGPWEHWGKDARL